MPPRRRTGCVPLTVALAVLAASTLSATAALAQAQWGLCGASLQLPAKPAGIRTPAQARAAEPGEIRLTADSADLSEGKRSVLTGHVLMEKDDRIVAADRAVYDEEAERLDAEGDVRYWVDDLFLSADQGYMEFSRDEIEAESASFVDLASHAHGDARHVRISGSAFIQGKDGTYTTCNPGDPDWLLEASKLDLDRVADVGTAYNVKVLFKGYPIFYSPFLTFTLSDKRKSGLLAPSFRLSGEAGTELRIPYYFNIAPNQDATLTPRLTSKRGLALDGEYRYLHTWGAGQLDLEYVPYDLERKGPRGLVKYRHLSEAPGRWRGELQYDRVSDRDYFADFGDSLEVSSTSYLVQQGTFDYWGPWWWGRARVESYQTVDPSVPGTSRPYQRLPQLATSGLARSGNRRLNVGYWGEYVHFDRQDSVTGHRLDLFPYLSFPIRTGGWFVVPRTALRYTTYALSNVEPGEDESPNRLLPTFSLDSGLFFERKVNLFGGGYTSTLEPRVFYLLVPYDNQDDLPVFDTGNYTFSFAQLFREDRFSGADRMGDANQLTLALTSRLLNPETGAELLRASIGQIRYFRDREVTLNTAPETSHSSDLVAEVAAQVGSGWSVNAGMLWNPQAAHLDKDAVALRFQPGDNRVLNLTYRFLRGSVEQADASFRWPLRHDLGVVGRLDYSVSDGQLLETFGGIEYESCCWAVRAVARRYLANEDDNYNTSIFLQLELKGLAWIGQKAGAFLERSIPGYHNNF